MLLILLECKETHFISPKAFIKLLVHKSKEIIRPMKKSFIKDLKYCQDDIMQIKRKQGYGKLEIISSRQSIFTSV